MMSRLLAALLAGAITLFGLVIWNEQTTRAPDTETTAAAGSRPLPALAGRPAAESVDRRTHWVETILARPLFSPGRRPAAQAAVAAAIAPVQTLPRMTAILIDGTKRNAIFAARDGGRPVVVSEGGRIGPFTVQSIGPQQVTVIGPDGQRAVRTSFDPHPPAPVVLAAPAGFLAPPPLPPQIVLPGAQPALVAR